MKIQIVKKGTFNAKPLAGCPTLLDEDQVHGKKCLTGACCSFSLCRFIVTFSLALNLYAGPGSTVLG